MSASASKIPITVATPSVRVDFARPRTGGSSAATRRHTEATAPSAKGVVARSTPLGVAMV